MKAFTTMRIGRRLGLGFGLVLLLMAGVALLGLGRMAAMHDRLEEITQVNNAESRLAMAMRIAVNQVNIQARNVVLDTDAARRGEELKQLDLSRARYNAAEQKLDAMLAQQPGTSEKAKALFARVVALKEAGRPALNKALELAQAGDREAAIKQMIDEAQPRQTAWLHALGDLADHEEALSLQAEAAANAAYETGRTLVVALSVAAVVAGVFAAWAISRSITGPIAQAVQIARTVATGDLGSRIEVRRGDEAGQLLQALKDMNDSLVQVVGQVRSSSESIATAAGQIASGNADLSQRTEEQASNLQQTAASMEQMTGAVAQNAETARTVAQLAGSARGVANHGGAAVQRLVHTMEEISAASRRITEIIGVIDGIAFQTNILALNAAVEAARAGEHGKGFAVVASEVRTLAQRSAQAAREIKGLIAASVEKVDAGGTLVADAGRTIGDVVGQVNRIADLVGEISAATDEQSTGIGQVGAAVSQLDQVTQQNAALVEEAAAAADSLSQQAAQLVQAVGRIRH